MAKSTTTYRYTMRQIVGIVWGLFLLATTAAAESDIFFPPHSRPFHKTFPRWSAEWWQFVLSFPMPENPLLDSTGEKCAIGRSEEHTSELQSQSNLVCRLLLEKKKNIKNKHRVTHNYSIM